MPTAGAVVRVDAAPVTARQTLGVLGGHDADEDTGRQPPRAAYGDAGPFHGLPGGLQKQPLLRVEGLSLTLRDAEETGVEVGHARQEARAPDIGAPCLARPRIVDRAQPGTVVRNLGHRMVVPQQELPVRLGRAQPTGKPQRHPDHRQRRVAVGLELGDAGPEPPREPQLVLHQRP